MSSMYQDVGKFGPNVDRALTGMTLVIEGRVPRQVRSELNAAVKAGALRKLKKDGRKPEVYYNPDYHRSGAVEIQERYETANLESIKRARAAILVQRDPMEILEENERMKAVRSGERL